MSEIELRWHWRDDGLVDSWPAETGEILVAESWLAIDSKVLAFELHVDRFLDSVARTGEAPFRETAEQAIRALAEITPERGEWWNRIDLTSAGFLLQTRPAPERFATTVLATAPQDPRTSPTIKGPDLQRLGALQRQVHPNGGGEVCILDDGFIAEGAYSGLMWWRGDTLCVPSVQIPHLPSTTSTAILALAEIAGIRIERERSKPSDLEGCEVWAVNALHGIRGVTHWIDGPELAPLTRLVPWQDRLDKLRKLPV
ncbi:aminotransferase class IV [Humidisolicoccus flavus]|uniref:aminotransferase class IV n=1 Tax=Humidisolicoccus flavus TaxID=3111414 RepID=UPI0032458220